jgi:hypothetical protein
LSGAKLIHRWVGVICLRCVSTLNFDGYPSFKQGTWKLGLPFHEP